MSAKAKELKELLDMFGDESGSSEQGWSDVGFDICKRKASVFGEEDWECLIDQLDLISSGSSCRLVELSEVIPHRFKIHILVRLVVCSSGEGWVAAAEEMGELCSEEADASEEIRAAMSDPKVIGKIQEQLVQFINMPPHESESRSQYISRYSHLLYGGLRKIHELVLSHNNSLQARRP